MAHVHHHHEGHAHDHDHDHDHDHEGHGHGHGHGGHGHGHHGHSHAAPDDWRYGVGIVLNLAFVVVEAIAGFIAHSTALLADAGHNLSDVLGLLLAGGAAWLARRPAGGRRTYGFAKATVLAALANALVLIFACGGIVWEAVRRFATPEVVEPGMVMIVAGAGVVVNTATALMFVAGRKNDVNIQGAFLHMAADAAVSAGVIVAGLIIALTHLTWVDPVTSLIIVVIIFVGTWGLLRESVNLALDAAPAGVDLGKVQAFLEAGAGVAEVHDLHVWAMSTTQTALTVHIVRPDGEDDETYRQSVLDGLKRRFGVNHATLQIERARSDSHCLEH